MTNKNKSVPFSESHSRGIHQNPYFNSSFASSHGASEKGEGVVVVDDKF